MESVQGNDLIQPAEGTIPPNNQIQRNEPESNNLPSKRKQESTSDEVTCKRCQRQNLQVTDHIDVARKSVEERAEKMLAQIGDAGAPTCKREMLLSNVIKGFWMYFPIDFSRKYLPQNDGEVTLIDENENVYKTTYLVNRHGLSAGWKTFSTDHNLQLGDILIFKLEKYYHFKVHIVRVYDCALVEAANTLLRLSSSGEKERKTDVVVAPPTPRPCVWAWNNSSKLCNVKEDFIFRRLQHNEEKL